MEWFIALSPIYKAAVAGLFTWLCTAVGSSLVFFFKQVNVKLLDAMNGFAAGVMIAASYWSLLAPSIQHAEDMGYGHLSFVPALVGFVGGAIFLRLVDVIVPHLHMGFSREDAEGPVTSLSSTTLLFLAITIHNIPEGLSVGVAFGLLAFDPSVAALASATALAIGIGLQNFPEGAALALPYRASGVSAWKAFNLGQGSALVEIVAAIVGAWLVHEVYAILPYALSFAAGAMVFVCVEELIPNSQSNNNRDIATMAFVIGFAVMMTLDVALG